MGFTGVYGVIFPTVILRVALYVVVMKETVLSVINLLLGRGWENPSMRMFAAEAQADWLYYDGFEAASLDGSFESRDATSLAEEIRTSLPVFQFGDISDKFAYDEEVLCSVCLCDFAGDEEVRQTPRCSHVFHKDCLDRWLEHQTTCPLCRCSLATEELLAQRKQKMHADAELAAESALLLSYPSSGRSSHWWQAYSQGLPEMFSPVH